MDFINYDCNSLYRYVLRFPRTSPLPGRGVPDRAAACLHHM